MRPNEQKPRRKYDATFKQEVLNMIAAGRQVPDVARSLGIGENVIYRWRRKAAAAHPEPSGSSPALVFNPETEALHRRIRELETERDILKKALGIFSRQA
jgi:transposase